VTDWQKIKKENDLKRRLFVETGQSQEDELGKALKSRVKEFKEIYNLAAFS
jgi:hypothetical protein